VFELHRRPPKTVAVTRLADGVLAFDLQIAWLFHVRGVEDEVWSFLRLCHEARECHECHEQPAHARGSSWRGCFLLAGISQRSPQNGVYAPIPNSGSPTAAFFLVQWAVAQGIIATQLHLTT